MKNLPYIILFLSPFAFCDCVRTTSNEITVSIPDIIVNRDTPVGAVIGTFYTTFSGADRQLVSCDKGNVFYKMIYNNAIPSGIEHVYLTNITGMGISLKSAGGFHFDSPPTVHSYDTQIGIYQTSPSVVELVKTGPVTSGVLLPGTVAILEGDDHLPALTLTLPQPSNITQTLCTLITESLNFELPKVVVADFGSTAGFTPQASTTKDLMLECEPGANINITLQGNQNPDVNDSSVLAISNEGGSGVAGGVGVQLLYKDKPLQLNAMLNLKVSPGGPETISLSAKYYQTKSNVTPGSLSACAMLNITYQ